jgi:HopJ type III effector protein
VHPISPIAPLFCFTMKVSIAVSLLVSAPTAFALITGSRPKPSFLGQQQQQQQQHHAAASTTRLNAEIRAPTEKAQELRYVRWLTVHSQHMECITCMHACMQNSHSCTVHYTMIYYYYRFGWDGTTALGGAVEVAKPARMLNEIRAAGETVPSDCEVFNGNLQMSADGSDDIVFKDVMELIDTHYESQLLEFKNGDIVNMPGENEGSAKILSYAALSNLDEKNTLKLWGEYYRDVLKNPNGTDHANIRNFIKYGWKGVPFENGIALTRKNVGDGEWDTFAESWIP